MVTEETEGTEMTEKTEKTEVMEGTEGTKKMEVTTSPPKKPSHGKLISHAMDPI